MADRKELRTDLRITGENAVKRGLKDVGDAADRAGDQLDDLGKEAGFLGKQADEAKTKVKGLIDTLNETGDLTLLKEIRKGKRELRLFEGLKKELEGEIKAAAVEVATPGGGSAGGIIGEGIAKGIGAAVAAGGPYLIGTLAGVAAAAAPFVGGVIAAAVVGGTGIGGIAGGLALASQDTRVKQAAEQLAATAKTSFELAGQEFVLPAIDSLHRLERASIDVASGMGAGFKAVAPTLAPFTDGVIGFVDELLPDMVAALTAARPVIRAIAHELPPIGDALGDFFLIVSEDTDGAILAWQTFSRILQGTIRGTGQLIANLSEMFEWTVRTGATVSGVLEDVYQWVPFVGDIFENTNNRAEDMLGVLAESGDASRDFSGGLSSVATEADNAAREIEALKDASDNLFGITMDLDKAVLAYKESIVATHAELAEGTRTLDLNTQAGRDNMETSLNAIGVIEQLRDAEAASTLGLDEANKRYAIRLEALKKDMLQMGFNKKAVEELILKYLAVPNAINVQLNLKAGGDAQAWSAFRAIERQTVPTVTTGPGGFTSTLDGRRAAGGPTRANRRYLVGENGPEIWSENANGFITPADQTAALMSGASGGGSQPVVNLTIAPSGSGNDLEAVLWEWFAKRLRMSGGAIGRYRIPRNET